MAARICFSVLDSVYISWRRISPRMITVSAGSLVTTIIHHLNLISDQRYTQIATSDVTQQYLCRFKSSGIICRLHWQLAADNSRVLAASICLYHCRITTFLIGSLPRLPLSKYYIDFLKVDTPLYCLDPEEGDRKLLLNFDKYIQIDGSHITSSTYFSNV